MHVKSHLSATAHFCFPNAMARSTAWPSNRTTEICEKYASVAGYAVADALLIGPKLLLGTRRAAGAPRNALETGILTWTQRGAIGSAFFAAAKIVQFTGGLTGATVGAVACAVGAIIGRGNSDWISLCAGKGWQIGTIVATVIMAPSELIRIAFLHAIDLLIHAVEYPLSTAGNLAGQVADVFCTAPHYHSV